jgi:hypothetical protein
MVLAPAQYSPEVSPEFSFSCVDDTSQFCGFKYALDGGSFVELATGVSSVRLAALPQGSHTLQVHAVDQAGNVEAKGAGWSWTVDHTSPVAEVPSRPQPLTGSASASFSFDCLDGGARGSCVYRYRLDAATSWRSFGAVKLELQRLLPTNTSVQFLSWTAATTAVVNGSSLRMSSSHVMLQLGATVSTIGLVPFVYNLSGPVVIHGEVRAGHSFVELTLPDGVYSFKVPPPAAPPSLISCVMNFLLPLRLPLLHHRPRCQD